MEIDVETVVTTTTTTTNTVEKLPARQPEPDRPPVVVHLRASKDRGKIQGCDVYIGRAMSNPFWNLDRSEFANPYPLTRYSTANDRIECMRKYRQHVLARGDLMAKIPGMAGKVLGCWCKPKACHGDVLAELCVALRPLLRSAGIDPDDRKAVGAEAHMAETAGSNLLDHLRRSVGGCEGSRKRKRSDDRIGEAASSKRAAPTPCRRAERCTFCAWEFSRDRPWEYMACDRCSVSPWDVFCVACISICETCGDTGCVGCNSVDSCIGCHKRMCGTCMGSERSDSLPGCIACGSYPWCDNCLCGDGRCAPCSISDL